MTDLDATEMDNQEIDGTSSVELVEIKAGISKTTAPPINLLPPIFDDIVPLPPPLRPTTVLAPASIPGAQYVYGGFSRDPNSSVIHHGDSTTNNLQIQENVIEEAFVENDDQETHLLESDSTGTEPRIPNQRSKKYWRQRLLHVLSLEVNVFLLVVMVILLIFLAVSINTGGHTSSNSSQPTGIDMAPSNPQLATMAPTTFLESLNLPDYTLSNMERAQSPQSKAYQWLIQNVNNKTSTLQDLPLWRLTQRFALATFYYSTRGDHWVKKNGWLEWEMNECDWEQLHIFQESSPELNCNDKGEITSLAFEMSNNLEGTIPLEMLLLGNRLESFLLYRQLGLTGSIPTEVGLLKKLTELTLSITGISGTLPTELGRCESLQSLYIVQTTQINGPMPSQIGLLSNLLELSLMGADLTGPVPGEVYQLPGLNSFSIQECHGLDTETILQEAISKALPLQTLVLSTQSLGTKMPIPSEIGTLRELGYLGLVDWKIDGTVPKELGCLSELLSLDLHDNSISGTMPLALFELTNLVNLNLGFNQLQGTLPPVLFSKLSHLQFIYINDNMFSGTIPTEVGQLSGARKLELQNTNLSGTLPTEILMLENLNSLVLKNTSLSGSIPEELCNKLYQQEVKCYGDLCKRLPVKTNTTVCHGTSLCGCDCGPCQN
ncbi:Leucine Rich Repeat [Seminavis robusta]|uniref:Leucine Rich Repeat n=1 Tax=Seminavis robusta TaxID=568900 RepID=A0A9N8ESI7_9STRA|nr:Leucine Rich Repeat [Seminavis robusta]|eukprot:Sro1555_g282120.1 Leucine Rich Repeat (662) ;mRNA; r:6974-9275